MTFHVSSPLLDLLNSALADPRKVNAVIDRRLARGNDARMRPGDHYPGRIRRSTGVPIVGITRLSRHLLVEIESRTPLWRYREFSRNNCSLGIPVRIPETLRTALVGRLARSLVLTSSVIDDLTIKGFEEDDAWTIAQLDPDWTAF